MSRSGLLEGKRVLVTGASGFIGKSLCIKLKEQGALIQAVSTRDQKHTGVIDNWFIGDLANYDFTLSTIEESQPEVIFHLAGYTTGQRELKVVRPTYHNNLTTTVNTLIASTEAGIKRLIIAGSLEEPEINGEEKATPVSPYAASKWASTLYARMFHKLYQTPVTIARIFMVYGPGDRDFDNLVPYVIRSLSRNKNPKLTSGKRKIDWIYIDDVVRGLIKMAYSNEIEGKSIDLGSGKLLSVKDICDFIVRIVNSDGHIEYGVLPDRAFERVRVADVKTTQKILDWKADISIKEGLKKTVRWYLNDVLREK